MDYVFNPRHKLSFYTVYVGLDAFRERYFTDSIGIATPTSNVEKHYETKVVYQNIYNATLSGEHTLLKNLVFDWKGAYSKAWANSPDWGTLVENGSANSTTFQWKSFHNRWMRTSDQDIAWYANLTYSLNVLNQGLEVKVGGMNRNKTRTNFYDDYTLNFAPNQPVTSGGLAAAQFGVYDGLGTPQDANNYTINEEVSAGYGQLKLNLFKRLQMLGGVRVENTSQNYYTAVPDNIPGKYGSKLYYDILPSGSLKFNITNKQNLRANYYASLSRPSFYELVPYIIAGEDFNEIGNPYLKHTTADNYDIRYEFFPKPNEQILAGVFYKNITNPVEYAFTREVGSPSALDLQPQNFGNATNYGFEMVASKFIRHFGVTANYTYTKSQITTTKILYYNDPVVGNTNKLVSQTRPLQGQADNVANVSLIYKNPKLGLDLLVSGVYTGKLISSVSAAYGLDYWQMPTTRLDFSGEKVIGFKKNKYKFYLFVKVNNILNTKTILRIMQPNPTLPNGEIFLPIQDSRNSIIVQRSQYGQGYLIGIRYKI
jgi:TonB-dependent receptor